MTTPQLSNQSQNDSCIFHSATFPQFIQSEQEQYKEDVEKGEKQINGKLSHSKLILHVLYYQRNLKTGQNQVKRRRFVIGNKDTKDLSDGLSQVNPLTLKSVRTRHKRLLVNSPDFDSKNAKEKGGFLNKQLWQANLLWGTGDSLQNNLVQLMNYIKNEMGTTHRYISKKRIRSSEGSGKSKHRFPRKGVKASSEKQHSESRDLQMTSECI